MAQVQVDSELMTNYVSAVPVPAGSHHVAVLDEKRMPLLFALSSDLPQARLRILRRNSQGRSEFFDLHKLIDLPENATVQTFHVEQSWSLMIHLAVAYRASETSSRLLVLKPFSPEQLHEGSNTLPKISEDRALGTIEKIYMSPLSGISSDVKYPDIFLIHKNLNQVSAWDSDITHVHVDKKMRRWFATEELSAPENASQILDVAPATSPYGQGLYVLYVTQGITKLFARFLRPDPHATDGTMYSYVTNVQCPKGARCIASFLDDDGYSCLLVSSGDGLRYLTTTDSTSKDRPGKLAFDAAMFKDIRELSITQDREDITIWYRNSQGELGYVRTISRDLTGAAKSSMLLPSGSSSAFAPLVSSRDELTGGSVRQMVVSNDRQGNLMLLEQTDDIGLWRKTPFYAPSKTTPTELKSYTVTIKARGADSRPLANGSILLSASSSLSVLLNGQNTLLTKVPSWYDCDSGGSLDLIVPSDSLGSQILRIEQLRMQNGDIVEGFRHSEYDPGRKPMDKLVETLARVQSDKEAFKQLKTFSGENLFDANVRSDTKTMDAVQKQLGLITQAYVQNASTAPPNNTTLLSKSTATATFVAAAREGSDSFGNAAMDAWYWVREKASDVTEWFIDTAGTVWKFVCEIAGQVKEFVLDCVEKICEAATWIWEKAKVGWKKLVDFVGFVFDWDDILTTKTTISRTISAGFDYAGSKLDDVVVSVDAFFDDLDATIDRFGNDISSTKQVSENSNEKDSEVDKAQTATRTIWAQERLKNGGAGTDSKADLQNAKPQNAATDFWGRHIVPEVNKLNEQLSKIGTDITAIFNKDGSISINDVLTIGKDVLKAGVTVIRGIVKGLIGLVKGLVTVLEDIGNAEIEIPIFSWLYKSISGSPLTLFDAISLIIAIPTTVFSKLITGKAPPTFDNMDGTLMRDLLEGDKDNKLSQDTKTNWVVFKAEVTVGITLTSGAIGVMKLLYKMATIGMDEILEELDNGPGSLFDIFGIVVDMVGCLMAIPESKKLPGYEYRWAISSISFFRGSYHIMAYFSKGGPLVEKGVYCLDLLTVLANLGLSIAVGVAEHEASETWKDFDEESTNVGFVTAGLNTVAGISYFTAFFFKESQPEVSAIGACVMIGTMAGAAVLEGVQFKMQYDEAKAPRLTSPPAF